MRGSGIFWTCVKVGRDRSNRSTDKVFDSGVRPRPREGDMIDTLGKLIAKRDTEPETKFGTKLDTRPGTTPDTEPNAAALREYSTVSCPAMWQRSVLRVIFLLG